MAERHPGQDDIAHIAAFALDQPRILEPRNALPDSEFTHSDVPMRSTNLSLAARVERSEMRGQHPRMSPRYIRATQMPRFRGA